MESRVEQAAERKMCGYNCAQAVACTYCDLAGIEAAAAGGMKSLGVGPFYRSLHADYEAPLLCEVQNWDEILK